uniref:Uncharacterized protein n=1 Tax=Ditylenchus dipsaci TaxID=166011 RepID=A0A915EIA9_9BILA
MFDKLNMPEESANYEQIFSSSNCLSSNLIQDSYQPSESNGLLKTITHPAVEVHDNTLNYVETMNTVSIPIKNLPELCS